MGELEFSKILAYLNNSDIMYVFLISLAFWVQLHMFKIFLHWGLYVNYQTSNQLVCRKMFYMHILKLRPSHRNSGCRFLLQFSKI